MGKHLYTANTNSISNQHISRLLCWEQYDTTAVLTRKTTVAEKGLLDFFEILKVFF